MKIDRALIESVVAEVLKQISPHSSSPVPISKPTLLVVGDRNQADADLWRKIELNWDVVPYASTAHSIPEQLHSALFLNCGQDLLVKGALGISDTPESQTLAALLLNGVPVSLIPQKELAKSILSRETYASAPYIKQLLKYKDTLFQFGAEVRTLENFLGSSSNKDALPGSASTAASASGNNLNFHTEEKILPPKAETSGRKLLTQRDVQDCPEAQILVSSNTIITPLARDAARETGKTILVIDSKRG